MNTKKSQEKLPPSNYSVKFSDDVGRVAIVDKTTEKSIESFSPCIEDGFIVQRMQEIREKEIFKQQFMNIGGETREVVKGGLILPDGY